MTAVPILTLSTAFINFTVYNFLYEAWDTRTSSNGKN